MSVQVRVRSNLLFRGQAYESGHVLEVDPFDAYLLCHSSRAELVDQDDAAAVRKAVDAHNEKALAEAGERRPWARR